MELKAGNLVKKYGEKEALKGISFRMTEGIYGLLGPNGAGKSTLIHILTGNLAKTSGSVTWNGTETEKLGQQYLKNIGYVPQVQALYEDFTAVRYLSYIAALKGMAKKAAEKEIEWALHKVALSDCAGKKIRTFSGGMKQRLLIAQSVLGDPRLLILDEPTAGLDPSQRIAVRNLISEIAMRKIVLIATHIVTDVEYISREILMMKGGRIIRMAPRDELVNSLSGRVFELEIEADEGRLKEIADRYRIVTIGKDSGKLFVRVLAEHPAADFPSQAVRPVLEDVYLFHFGEMAHGKDVFQ